MPDFISKLKLDSLVNVEKEEVVSLIELLLGEQAEVYSKAKERARNEGPAGVKVRSRRDRRKSGRSAKTINKKSTKRAGEVQKMEQLRVAQARQEKRRKALLDYQLQSNNKRLNKTAANRGDSPQSSRAKAKQAEKEANSILIDPTLRPVILGLIDFEPIFDNEGKFTPAGNSLKVKRAARALGVENLFEVDTSAELIGELDWINALISNITQKKVFLESLNVTDNFSMYDEAMSAFEFDKSTASEASNTEILYTFIRDYAYSMTSCTPRLLELPDRDFESGKGRNLTGFPDFATNSIRTGFSTLGQTSNYVTRNLPTDDNEVNFRYLLATISREMLLSFNTNSNNLPIPETTRYGTRGRAASGFAFCDWMAIHPNAKNFKPVKKNGALSNLFGIVATTDDRSKDPIYSFEPAELISEDNREKSAQLALNRIYEDDPPSENSGPYTGILSEWSDAAETIENALDIEELGLDNSPGYEVLETICREVIMKCLDSLPSDGNGSAGKAAAAQIAFLTRAGVNDTTLRWLILYLCFLQDQLSGAAMTGQQTNPAALSSVVKNDSNLFQLIDDKPANSSNTTRFFEVPESTISVSPLPVGDSAFTNPQKIDALSVQQTLEVAAGQDDQQNSSINAFFGMSFEEACEACALGIRGSLATETTAISEDISDKTSLTLDDLKDTLMGLATSNDSIFSDILTLLDAVRSTFSSGCFDEIGLSYFTRTPAASIHVALIAATAKAAYFVLDDLIQNEGKMSGVFQTGETKTIKAVTAKTSKALVAAPFFGPRMAMNWNSAGSKTSLKSPGGASIKFSFAGVGAVRDSLQSFLDSEEQELAILDDVSPVLGRTFNALNEEQEFSTGFITSLVEYLTTVTSNYKSVVDTITSDIDSETEGVQSLSQRIKTGLPLSSDMARNLVNFTRVYDSSDSTYRDIRTRDKAIVSANMSFMADILQDSSYCEPDKIKYMIVGLPSGLLDKTQESPIDLSKVDRELAPNSSSEFVVSIEKVDLTKPDLQYVDKDYSFSRNLFINSVDISTESEISVNFDCFDSQFSVSEQQENGLSNELYSTEQINNLKNDFALKLYSDIFLDLDFFPDAFPKGEVQKSEMLTGSVSLPALAAVNKKLTHFLVE